MSLQQIYQRFAERDAQRQFWHVAGAVLIVGIVVGYFVAWVLS